MMPTRPSDFEEVVIQALRLGISGHFNVREMGWRLDTNSEVRAFVDTVSRDLVIQLVANIAHKEHTIKGPVVEVKYPAGWWEAFKERWAPRWWLRRWPVKMLTHPVQTYEVKETRLCPHLPMRTGDGLQSHVRFLVDERSTDALGPARLSGLPDSGRRHVFVGEPYTNQPPDPRRGVEV